MYLSLGGIVTDRVAAKLLEIDNGDWCDGGRTTRAATDTGLRDGRKDKHVSIENGTWTPRIIQPEQEKQQTYEHRRPASLK